MEGKLGIRQLQTVADLYRSGDDKPTPELPNRKCKEGLRAEVRTNIPEESEEG